VLCSGCEHLTVKGTTRVMKKLLFFFCPDCWRDRRACELIMIKMAAPSLMPKICSITLTAQLDDQAIEYFNEFIREAGEAAEREAS
jgi:hypothetical protein